MTLREYYESFRGARVYNAPLIDESGQPLGNHGDHLMVLGAQHVHRDLSFEYVDDPKLADLLVIGGNGGMFGWIDTGIPRILRALCHEYPDTPVCMEPATFFFPNQSITRLIGTSRAAPITLFCRERFSHDALTAYKDLPRFCTVQLDHDMAMELRGTPLADSLRDLPVRHILIVERTDMEHPATGFEITNSRRTLNRLCPRPLKRALYPLVTRWRSRRDSDMLRQCRDIIARDRLEGDRHYPLFVQDISNVNTCSFDEFCHAIGHARAVFTQRLHVGLLSAVIGTPTYLFDGPYYKIRGVYEYSLSKLAHVAFQSNTAGWVVPARAAGESPTTA